MYNDKNVLAFLAYLASDTEITRDKGMALLQAYINHKEPTLKIYQCYNGYKLCFMNCEIATISNLCDNFYYRFTD